MSYILDALNKSEQERRNTRAPNLETVHRVPHRDKTAGTPWVLILVVLVILNTLLAVYWFNSRPSPPAVATPVIEPEAQKPATIPTAETQPAPPEPEAVTANVEQAQLITPDDYFRRQAPVTQPADPPPLRFSELPPGVQQQIPEINISSHIYGTDPTFRMATINEQIVREGDMVTQSIRLDEITEDGVVLQYLHYRFAIRIQ